MRVYLNQLIDGGIVAKDLTRPGLSDPIDHGVRIRTPSLGKSREGVNDVADGSELDEKDPHVKTMLPKISAMFEPLFCSVIEQI
jgi:hypothetical protein